MSTVAGVNVSSTRIATDAFLDPWQEAVETVFSQFEASMTNYRVSFTECELTLSYSNNQKSTEVKVSYRSGILRGTLRKGTVGCLHLDLIGVRELPLAAENAFQEAVQRGLEDLILSLSKVSPDEYYFDISDSPSPELPKEPMPAPKLGSGWLDVRNIEKIREGLEEEEVLAGIRYIFGDSSSV